MIHFLTSDKSMNLSSKSFLIFSLPPQSPVDNCCPSVSHFVSLLSCPWSCSPLSVLSVRYFLLSPSFFVPFFILLTALQSALHHSCSRLIPLSLRWAPLAYRCLTEAPFRRTAYDLLFLFVCVRVCLCVCNSVNRSVS